MAVVALTNIFHGKKSYIPGEVIEGSTEKEERRLIELKYAEALHMGAAVAVQPKEK
jgi:hypothetical protein